MSILRTSCLVLALVVGACGPSEGAEPTPTTSEDAVSTITKSTTPPATSTSTTTSATSSTSTSSSTTTTLAIVDASQYPESWAQALVDAANADDFGQLESYVFASEKVRNLFQVFVESDLPQLDLVGQCDRGDGGAGCWVTFDGTQVYSVSLNGPTHEEMFNDIYVQALPSETLAADGAYGSGCSPGSGPLADGLWFGFVVDRHTESFDFDLACIYPDPVIDQPPVNISTDVRSVAVDPNVLVGEMRTTEPYLVGTTYGEWRPAACQFEEGCAVWTQIRNGRAIYLSEEFFS